VNAPGVWRFRWVHVSGDGPYEILSEIPTPPKQDDAAVKAITHFDPAWGEPPPRPLHRWNRFKHVYEPFQPEEIRRPSSQERILAMLRAIAEKGIYLQVYRTPATGRTWLERWVRVPAQWGQPYEVLESTQELAAALGTGGDGSALDIRAWAEEQGLALGTLGSPISLTRPSRVAPPTHGDPGDYAWVKQRDLPIGCPYPYPYMPVPQDDYVLGRWLEPDYVPSIPLPPPYDEVPWQCGVPGFPGTEHKGGPTERQITSDDIRARRRRLLAAPTVHLPRVDRDHHGLVLGLGRLGHGQPPFARSQRHQPV